MELKDYQQQTLDTFNRYLEALKEARQQADKATAYLSSNEVPDFLMEQAENLAKQAEDYPQVAWENLRKASVLPSVTDAQGQNLIPEHISRESAAGEPIPHVCLKVPTGGGKNLVRCRGSTTPETRQRVCVMACPHQSHLYTDVGRFPEQRASVSTDSGAYFWWTRQAAPKR